MEPKPFLKWVGGKRQLLGELCASMPKSFNRYFEPFVGGGALFFALRPKSAIISDANPELINCYRVIRDKVDALVEDLRRHRNEEEYFYKIRAADVSSMTDVERASRFIYLNRTCYNGLYRENSKGQFNSPFGRYKNPKIVDEENLRAVSSFLSSLQIVIMSSDYRDAVLLAGTGDFVYLDPPYFPMTKTANFANYTKNGFGLREQEELAEEFRRLTSRGVLAMLSNSNTPLIHDLYKGFNIRVVQATRAINCKGEKRGAESNEVIVTNY